MLLTIVAGLGVALLVALLYDLAKTVTRAHRQRAILESNGIPMMDGFTWYGGQLGLAANNKNYKLIIEQHRKHGHTLGYVHARRRLVVTTDLDLINRMINDHPQHVNRTAGFDVPLQELDKDSLVTVRGDQWRRVRRAFAPAFA